MARRQTDRGQYGPPTVAWLRLGLTSLLLATARIVTAPCAWVRPTLRSAGSALALPPRRRCDRRIFVPVGWRSHARTPLRRPPIAACTAEWRHGWRIDRFGCPSDGYYALCTRGDRGLGRQSEPIQEYRADHGLGDRLGGALLRVGVDRRHMGRTQSVGQPREAR